MTHVPMMREARVAITHFRTLLIECSCSSTPKTRAPQHHSNGTSP